jgi:hypothetical protein
MLLLALGEHAGVQVRAQYRLLLRVRKIAVDAALQVIFFFAKETYKRKRDLIEAKETC